MKKVLFILLFLFNSSVLWAQEDPVCAEISDQFCDKLWSVKNRGNLKEDGNAFYLGDSPQSELSMVQVNLVDSFIQAWKSFPADFKKRMEHTVQRLSDLLKNQEKGATWYRSFVAIFDQSEREIQETSDERTYFARAKLKGKKWEDYTYQDRVALNLNFYDLKNQVMDAQFKKNPNWKRIERVFVEVKKDLLELIPEFPAEIQDYAYEKVSTVRLTLPYQDRRTLGASYKCATTEDNAYYDPTLNVLTFCVGRFMGIQNDSSHYRTIAHEIAHSIDPGRYNLNTFKRTQVGKILEKFYRAKGPIEACDLWEKDKQTLLEDTGFVMGVSPYDNLISCLRSRDDLNPFEESAVKNSVDRKIKNMISDSADANYFTYLAQPTIQKYGKTRDNEYYMRPDRLNAKINDYVSYVEETQYFDIPTFALFTQILSCNSQSNDPEKGFSDSMKEYKEVAASIKNKLYMFCGRECEELVEDNLALNTSETFADWVAFKLITKRLLREKGLNAQRKFVAQMMPQFCERPGPLKDAYRITKIEKNYSMEAHDENRVRRMSVFQPEIIEIIQCKVTDDIPKQASVCAF